MTQMNNFVTSPSTEVGRDQITTHEELISRRAQQLWEKAGRPAERDVEFWLQAEREILTESSTLPSADLAPERMAQVDVQTPPTQASAQPRKAKRGSKANAR